MQQVSRYVSYALASGLGAGRGWDGERECGESYVVGNDSAIYMLTIVMSLICIMPWEEV